MKVFVSPTSFLKPQNAKARALLEANAETSYNELGRPLEGDEIISRLSGADAYLAGLDYITADVVEKMPESVKVISRYGTGVDRVDLAACEKRGVIVTNTPGANATAVCELAFALMLAVARNIPALHSSVCGGAWPRNEGIELAGKTLGILGLGAIGKRLAVRAKAFEMRVLAYDPYLDRTFAGEHGIEPKELDGILAESDFISLHLPLNESTRYLINEQRIGLMRRGAIIINTSRGGLLDEAAAASALKEGRLGGLGLDAFEREPLTDSPLMGLKGVVFTPHTGAHTAEAVEKMGLISVQNVLDVLAGRDCPFRTTK